MRALIIEDDRGVQMCIAAGLKGYTIHYAETLSSALQVLRSAPFDVVFIDLGLPDSSPENTVRSIPAIRQLSGNAGLIVATGNAAAIENIKLTVDAVLDKPFHSEHVQEALRTCQKSVLNRKDAGYGVKSLLSLFAMLRAACLTLALFSLSGCVTLNADLPTKYGHFRASTDGSEILLGYKK